jgi:hypothetical protein
MKSLRSRAFGWLIAVSLGCLAAPTHASAQAGTGTLSGTVVNEQGAAIPGANVFNLVQYTNLDTNLTFQDDSSVPGTDNLLLTSTTHGRYTTTNNNTGTTPPRQIGITLRLDF